MRYLSLCAGVLLVLVWLSDAHGQSNSPGKPIRRINLRSLGYDKDDLITIAFCKGAVLIYQRRPGETLALGPCDGPPQEQAHNSSARTHVVAQRKQMAIEQVCDQESCKESPGAPRIRSVKYYLKRPDTAPVLLFEEHCLGTPPLFLADEYILFVQCDLKNVVVNDQGKQLYQLPAFAFPFVAVSRDGTRFAVYERDVSFWHGLAGTTDRIRVSVFQTLNGKKLFKLGWHTNGEAAEEGQMSLSDDGSLLAVVRSGEVLVFAIHAP